MPDDRFPPGTKVSITCARGQEIGVTVAMDKPTDLQIGRQPIVAIQYKTRVPVMWQKNGEVTWIVPSALQVMASE